MKTTITVQANNCDTVIADLEKAVKEEIKATGIKVNTITNLNLYFKPVENECYYVAEIKNGEEIKGKINC